jgi:hypothetical protein
MALPSLLQRTEISKEKETMEILKDQKESLAKISETLISTKRDYGSMRKDMQDIKTGLMESIESFSELKKYFERSANIKSIEDRKLNIKESENKGFFSRAVSKLLGKGTSESGSDLQSKIYEEVKRTRALADNTDRAIQFIRRSYEPAQKEKDYEKLAALIGEQVSSEGGGSSAIGGIAMAIGGVATALVTQLGNLGTALITGVTAITTTLIKTIRDLLLAKNVISGVPDIDIDRDGKRRPGAPGKKGRVLVPGDVPDIDAPDKSGGKPSNLGKSIKDIVLAIGRAILARAPWILAITGGVMIGAMIGNAVADMLGLPPKEEVDKQKADAAAEKRRQDLQKQMDEEYERKQKLYKSEEFKSDRDAVAKEFMESKIDQRTKQDILSIRDDEERYNKMLEALEQQKPGNAADAVADKVEGEVKSVVDKMKETLQNIAGEYLESTGQEIVNFLDNMKLPIGEGETVDILPGLGTFLQKELTDLTDSVAELATDKDTAPQNVSMVTQNNINGNSSTPMVFPSPVVRDTDPAVALYKMRAALV